MTRGTRLCLLPAALLWLTGGPVLGPSAPSAGLDSLAYASGLCWASFKSEARARRLPFIRQGIVFVADGAGGFEAASHSIRNTAAASKLPLEIRTFHWTHGYCRVIRDQMHASHVSREGQKLAEAVLNCRQEAPDQPIYLVGHSAGCGVVLIAAENLPPNTVARVVLLAPAVASKRDLRGALQSSCRGIDAFISSHDWACLGLGTLLTGTTDRCWTTRAAGKIGFQPIANSPEDESLYAKLRQYPWEPSLIWTGHKGGHYGAYQPGFLQAFVFPLLQE